MNTGRKVRADAKLERLSAAQKKQLLVWLDDENRSYLAVAALVQAEFGLTVGKSAVAGYWHRHVLPRRYWAEAGAAQDLAELPEGKFTEASLKLARMQLFSALAQPAPDVRAAARLMTMVNSAERVVLARQRQAWVERRAAAATQSSASAAPEVALPGAISASEPRAQSAIPAAAASNPPLYPGYAALSCTWPEEKIDELQKAS